MGWWSKDGLLLGDDPVDWWEASLGELRAQRVRAGQGAPTLQALLDALASALALPTGAWTNDGPLTGRLRATRTPPEASIVSASGQADPALERALLRALDRIVQAYEMGGPERRPTRGEILACVAFSLRVEPERFLAPEPGQLLDLVEEPPPRPPAP